jgi:hypothetical protein
MTNTHHPELTGALKVIKQSAYCQTERDVKDFAEAMLSSFETMRGTMADAGLPELSDDEISMIAENW